MNDLATQWVLMTVFVFSAGALVALVWSILTGQWTGLAEAAMVPLQDGDDLDDAGRPGSETTIDPDRHAPVG